MALEHMPADSLQMLKVQSNPAMRALCGNWQEGDSVATTVAHLPPAPPTCPKCYALTNPGVTTEALAAMEA